MVLGQANARDAQLDRQPQTASGNASFAPAAPSLSLPKGGGAIRGIGEKFAANPVTGTGSMSVPIATSPGRSGFGPHLALSYDSGSGNGPFGFGWSLSLPSITRKTDKGLPQYLDAADSDDYILSGAEDLVPVVPQDPNARRTVDGKTYRVRRYRPRIEGLFARIERWTNSGDANDVFWRSISKDNINTWYGCTIDSRIADPDQPGRIFSWLICQSHDDKGNVIVYGYKTENSARIFEDRDGKAVSKAHEHNRSDKSRGAQRYLKCVRYGNRAPYFPVLRSDQSWPKPPASEPSADGSNAWMFEAVFDYGEHDTDSPAPAGIWPARPDPFSSRRAGFEVRTYRICRRVLMFHHFPGEAGVERNCLVRSTDFTYSDEVAPKEARNPIYTLLKAVTQTGYRRSDGGYDSRSLPPVEFTYTEPEVQAAIEEVDPASLENLPIGIDGSAYRWTDLHGEGIPGILTEQAGAWYYKRNWSPIPTKQLDGSEAVKARFAPLETVALKPNLALSAGADFMDLAGDGQPDVVLMEGPTPGLYEHDEAEGWQSFRPFTSRLNRDLRDPNVKFVDLDGDGHADVLITENDAFVWHVSLAEEGFGPARRVAQARDEQDGPRIVFADGTQSIYLADLSGDGLTDLVRIRNGEVCYWPNLGYGRFGAKVTMDGSPWFDNPDQFDQKRIRLADIDGSGTTDIIYLHRDGVHLYFNQSGNGWSQPHALKVFPQIDDLASIVTIDLLGNGTACLVWSSALPGHTRRPMRYVNLVGACKPHLLVKTINNLGAETRVDYAPSTKFYLQDKRDGKPWITRLPFPVHVVERVQTYDHVSRNRFVTRYAYHHGHFDGEEREFRGFGMVEQWDTEQFAALADGQTPAANIDSASHVPPVLTRTWFHTGNCWRRDRVSNYFAGLLNPSDRGEYYREPAWLHNDDEAKKRLLPNTILPPGLSAGEEREAARALKGVMLRQEIYALDGVGMEADYPHGQPYTVAEQNFTVRRLQPRGANRHAVFFIHAREALTCHYERKRTEPRVQHALTLEVDDFGNVLRSLAVGYGRRQSQLEEEWDRAQQTTTLVTYNENTVTHPIGATGDPDLAQHPDVYRAPLPAEAFTYELKGFAPLAELGRFTFDEWEKDGFQRLKVVQTIQYEEDAPVAPRKRLIEHMRTLYRPDDCGAAQNDPLALLAPKALQPLALPGESYKLAFTPGLLDQVFKRPRQDRPDEPLLPRATRAMTLGGSAGDQGGYVDLDGDGHWWIPSGRSFHHPKNVSAPVELAEARAHGFLPRRYRDPFGQNSEVDFDAHDLLMVETRDVLGNRVTVNANDYRVLQPRLVSDPNRNQTEVAFDTLGMVVGTALMGKAHPAEAEGDSLAGFVTDLTRGDFDGFFDADDPHAAAEALLKDATTRIVYDLDRFKRTRQENPKEPEKWLPACAATLARETHVHAPLPPQGLKIQISFSCSDGFGREVQKKIQAEPGPVPQRGPGGKIVVGADGQPVMTADNVSPRWVGSGWTVFNNKGKPVCQYEPFFTDTHRFEFDIRIGVSPVIFYDPAERVIATLHPNHTYEKVVFDPWQQTSYDVNDTSAPRPAPPGDPRPAQTGDPRTDPDIGGRVAEYFKALPVDPLRPWQTWHAQRIGDALGPDERNAAERAAAHADTPTTAHFDALGRPFLTVARNRVTCVDHPLHGEPDEAFRTRVELDIEGNQRAVRDERKLREADNLPLGLLEQRTVMRYAYDMLGNRIHQLSMEAGARWMLNDVAGKPIRAWDSRGHSFTTTYDALRRPIEQHVQGTFSDPDPLKPNSDPRTLNPPNVAGLLVDKIEYGEPPLDATAAQQTEAQRLNLRTRTYRHFDSAGVVTNARLDATGKPTEAYDFKGNLLRSTRQLVSDYKAIPDWSGNPRPNLDAETFEGSTRYDALNRPIQSVALHSSLGRGKFNVIQPVFNEANLLERVDVWLERAAEPAALLNPANEAPSPIGVADIDYDAKGQRTLIDYKTRDAAVIRTSYAYDTKTFRLTHLYTRRGVNPATAQGVAFNDDCDNPNPPPATIAAPEKPPAGKGCGLQNLHYTHDPAGNITHIRDDAQQTIYFRNQRVEPSNDYVYDALYRLIQADGREHLGQGGAPMPHSYDDAGRTGILSANPAGQFAPNDVAAMGRYTERYVYDAVGNILKMHHERSDAAVPGWTRAYRYLEASLTEPGKFCNRLSSTNVGGNPAEVYAHDAHGNMLQMPQLQEMRWDYQDQLRLTRRQRVNADDVDGIKHEGERTFYVYDAAGQRIRKVCERSPGLTEERIYLGGFEIFRRHGGPIGANTATLERETLHVMDDKQRIALVETRTLGDEPDVPRRLIRYQYGNHLGSSSLELDEQAQIISYEEYAPYGSSTYQAVRSQTETAMRYRYTGKERDEESGLYYHGARYLAAWMGRWISCDPAGFTDSHCLFVYVADNPMRHSDPTGGGLWDTVKGKVSQSLDRAESAVKPGGAVFDAVDSAFNKNSHPVAAASLNNMANRGHELVDGVNQELKKTAEDHADIAYYLTHPNEPGAIEKLQAAAKSQSEAPLRKIEGAVVGFGKMVKRVGEAGGDIAYYGLSTEGSKDPHAGAKVASAVTDVVLDAPQIVLTVEGAAGAAKGIAGAVPKSSPRPYTGTVPIKGKPQVTTLGKKPTLHGSTSLEAAYDLGENQGKKLGETAWDLKEIHLPQKNPGNGSLDNLAGRKNGPKGSPGRKIPDVTAVPFEGKPTAVEIPSPSENVFGRDGTIARHLKAQRRGLEEGLFVVPPGFKRR
jgi:RHS repeat-associated protein